MKRNLTGRKHAVHYILLTMAQGMAKGGDGEEAGVAASHALKLAREAQDTEGVTITTMFINQLRLTFPSASIMDPAAILPTGRKEGVDKSVQVPLYLRAVAEAAEGVEGIMAGRHPRQTFQLLSSATQHAREPLPSPSAPPSISRPEGAHHPQNPSLFSPHLAIPSTLHLSSVAHASLGSSATATHSSLLAANLSLPGAAILASCRLARGLADQGRYRDAARVLERVKTSHPDVVRGADWGEWRRCAAEITFWRALRRGELGTAEVALNVVEGESSASHSGRVDGAAAGWAGWRAGYGTVEAMRAELTRRSGDGARAAKMVEEWAASLQGLERVAAFIEVGRVRMRSSSTLSALKPLLTAITLSKRQFAHPLYWRASVLLANLLIHLGMPRRGLAVANSVVTDVITHLGAEEKGETWEVLGRCLEESVAEPVQDKRADVPGVVPPHNPSVSYRLRHASTRASLLDSSAHHYALALSCYIQSDNLEAQSRVLALQADLAHRMNRLGDRNDAAKEYLALQEVGKRRARFAGRFGKEGVTDACEQVMDEWDREGRYG
ncbi:hypothetical protein M427DRAFT_130881 [Gonapodya prolifera JEL478]|uniref:Uncharacterized protein n=1 Tax=Gonapodya prolifera (strain JEL478) TaxID=1344416 RepID=A0A139AY81_GONPJ|nr:hypothetical protein M427DRAFT_130881 [Gonapodya prolifera JEL478]|eukprot:KXS21405.1 hypothetical protein M427DRAFT_130881 [Gonapodya prolifera JEL478]